MSSALPPSSSSSSVSDSSKACWVSSSAFFLRCSALRVPCRPWTGMGAMGGAVAADVFCFFFAGGGRRDRGRVSGRAGGQWGRRRWGRRCRRCHSRTGAAMLVRAAYRRAQARPVRQSLTWGWIVVIARHAVAVAVVVVIVVAVIKVHCHRGRPVPQELLLLVPQVGGHFARTLNQLCAACTLGFEKDDGNEGMTDEGSYDGSRMTRHVGPFACL